MISIIGQAVSLTLFVFALELLFASIVKSGE